MEDEDILNSGNVFNEGDTFNASEEFNGDATDAEIINLSTKLYDDMNKMSSEERNLFIKSIQYDVLIELLSAIKNLKKTDIETWKKVIFKLNAIKDIKLQKSGETFDFSDSIKKIIPSVGNLAGTLLALKEMDKKESEVSEQSEENITDENLVKSFIENEANKKISKSIILSYCNENSNGFSFNG